MRTSERIVLVAALALALAAVFGARFSGSVANAGGVTERASSAEGPVAVVDVYKVIEALLESDRFQPRIDEQNERVREQLEPLRQEIDALLTELRSMDQSSPEFQSKFAIYQQKGEQAQQIQARLAAETQKMFADAIVEAYELARTTAEGIAEDEGYAYVIASKSPEDAVDANNPQLALESLLGRPLLVFPDATDLTLDVLEDLQLDVEADDDEGDSEDDDG